MIDRTNVGLSPLMSTPVTTSFVSSTPVQTTYQTIPQTTSYVQEAYPTTSYGAQVINQGVTIPQTTTFTGVTQDPLTSFAPQITTPDQVLTSFVPETTTAPVQDVTAYPVTTVGTAPQTSVTTSVVPNVVLTQPQTAPQVPTASAPIMDEDFQRGRPIYDEFSEDRYRNFKFGH